MIIKYIKEQVDYFANKNEANVLKPLNVTNVINIVLLIIIFVFVYLSSASWYNSKNNKKNKTRSFVTSLIIHYYLVLSICVLLSLCGPILTMIVFSIIVLLLLGLKIKNRGRSDNNVCGAVSKEIDTPIAPPVKAPPGKAPPGKAKNNDNDDDDYNFNDNEMKDNNNNYDDDEKPQEKSPPKNAKKAKKQKKKK
jgi:hypothetical protein